MKIITSNLKPTKQIGKQIYLSTLMFFIGRAMQTAYRVDPYVKAELDSLPDNFSLKMQIADKGPRFFLKMQTKNNGKKVFKNYGRKILDERPTLSLKLRSVEAAWQVFTFQENSCEAQGYARFFSDGSFDVTCVFMRVLDELEMLLLPRCIAKHAVKRYLSPKNKHWIRTKLYFGTILGF